MLINKSALIFITYLQLDMAPFIFCQNVAKLKKVKLILALIFFLSPSFILGYGPCFILINIILANLLTD